VPQPPDKPPDLSPAVIDEAPDELPATQPPLDHVFWQLITDLQVENAALQAENDRLSAEDTIDKVKAKLIRPLANRIYWYMVAYTAFVGVTLFLHGFKVYGFDLPPTVLGLLTGTTLAAIVGLAAIILTGIFKKD
jgi:hypothetical protein